MQCFSKYKLKIQYFAHQTADITICMMQLLMNLSIKWRGRKQETIFLCFTKIVQGSFSHTTFQVLKLKDCGSFQFT